MGPLNGKMKELAVKRQDDIKYPITWTTLGDYLEVLERRGISPNVASFVGAPTIRTYVLGEADVQPTGKQLDDMRALVHTAMEEGALGVTTMLIYSPATYAKTPELIALATESARCGGIYTAHMRSEGDRIESALQETIDIAKASGAPAEVYHLKLGGRGNWGKLDRVVAMIDAARAAGVRITANMYTYTAGATGLDAAMPSWVQSGGLEAWIAPSKGPRDTRQGHHRNAQPAPRHLGKHLRGRGRRRHAAAGVQESQVEAAHRQDVGGGREDARREPGRRRHRFGHRRRLAGGRRLFPDERGQRAPRSGTALGQLRL